METPPEPESEAVIELRRQLAESERLRKLAETRAAEAMDERDTLKRIQSERPPAPPSVKKSFFGFSA